MPTELHDNLAKVIGMSRPNKKSNIANFPFVLRLAPEDVFLHIRNRLQEETNRKEDHSCDIASSTEFWLHKMCDVGRIEDSDWQRDDPDPDHLKDPESEKGEEFVSLVVEAVVFAGLDDSEEEKAGKAGAPYHDEEGIDDLARIVVTGESKGDDG